MFNVEGGRGSKKGNENEQGKGVQAFCEKNCLIFQTAKRVLSDKVLGSCLTFFCFEPSLAYKGGFLLERHKHFCFI